MTDHQRPSSVSYHLETNAVVWEDYKDTVPRSKTLNDDIEEMIAESLRERRDGDLEPRVRREINRILGGEGDV